MWSVEKTEGLGGGAEALLFGVSEFGQLPMWKMMLMEVSTSVSWPLRR